MHRNQTRTDNELNKHRVWEKLNH